MSLFNPWLYIDVDFIFELFSLFFYEIVEIVIPYNLKLIEIIKKFIIT
jgi:hypothetical protein